MARKLELPKGSYVVFDRGYTDYAWHQEPCEEDIRFVEAVEKLSYKSSSIEREKPMITRSWAFLGIGYISNTDLLEVAIFCLN